MEDYPIEILKLLDIKVNKPLKINVNNCDVCNNDLIRNDEGFMVCCNCGRVHEHYTPYRNNDDKTQPRKKSVYKKHVYTQQKLRRFGIMLMYDELLLFNQIYFTLLKAFESKLNKKNRFF